MRREGESIVSRTVADTSPPAVSYSLTDQGVELARAVDEAEQL